MELRRLCSDMRRHEMKTKTATSWALMEGANINHVGADSEPLRAMWYEAPDVELSSLVELERDSHE